MEIMKKKCLHELMKPAELQFYRDNIDKLTWYQLCSRFKRSQPALRKALKTLQIERSPQISEQNQQRARFQKGHKYINTVCSAYKKIYEHASAIQ